MKIVIFSSADRRSRSGNWVTAKRWQTLLIAAGHRVSILHDALQASQGHCDLLIGLHARRSSKALLRFRSRHPESLTVVALTGTDVYCDLSPTRKRQPQLAIRSLEQADRILLLQPLMRKRLRPKWKSKSSLVMMDALPRGRVSRIAPGQRDALRVCVVGHMRYEKDPLRAAMAIRDLPAGAGIRVTHAGQALNDSFRGRAEREHAENSGWNWRGSLSRNGVDRLMESSDLMVNSSRSEGAPNVLFEAIGFRLPVLATKIDGHVGVLGEGYPGYFRVGDTKALQKLLVRCRRDDAFYRRLVSCIDKLAKKYATGNEQCSLLAAISAAS